MAWTIMRGRTASPSMSYGGICQQPHVSTSIPRALLSTMTAMPRTCPSRRHTALMEAAHGMWEGYAADGRCPVLPVSTQHITRDMLFLLKRPSDPVQLPLAGIAIFCCTLHCHPDGIILRLMLPMLMILDQTSLVLKLRIRSG